MIPAKLLLIEDTPSDATLFIDQIQSSLGTEVEVEWQTRLNDALAWLEAGNIVDQIWLDPGLPDLGQQNVGRALATLKRYVAAGELRLLSSSVAPSVAKQAASQNVPVLEKDTLTQDSQVLQIVQELLAKRSGSSTTMRVEMARIEGAIAKMEYQMEELNTRVTRIEVAIERFSTLTFEINSVKEAIHKIPAVEKKLEELGGLKDLRVKRLDMMQAIVIALITGIVTIGVATLPKLMEDPASPPSSSPSPSR